MAEPGDPETSASDGPLTVGVGTSAGGLNALRQLLGAAPAEADLAFVIVQHIDPDKQSLLSEILGHDLPLHVSEAQDGDRVERGHVYTLPAGKAITIKDGVLHLQARGPGMAFPVDVFFRALAADRKDKAVGVILTGAGHDGVGGVEAIHEAGGIVVAQDPREAEFPAMPQAALDSGRVDLCLRLEQIVPRLVQQAEAGRPALDGDDLDAVLAVVGRDGQPDFATNYRSATLRRRVRRRMNLRGTADLGAYLSLLGEDEAELASLHEDLLLGVTSFFRDPKAFLELETRVVAPLFAKSGPVRAWVAGCATGEEAYSLAMVLMEARERKRVDVPIKVFATDIRPDAVAAARRGIYTREQLAEVAPERMRRFFEQEGSDGYRVSRQLRELVTFAVHDLLSDPPLPEMDVVCCRNLLIYLKPEAQERVLGALQFSLRPGGHLMLGTSETVSRAPSAFSIVSQAARIYRRTDADGLRRPEPRADTAPPAAQAPTPSEVARQWILERHTPPAVVVDAQRRIMFVHGTVEPFLRLPQGHPTRDVLAVARPELRSSLRTALHRHAQRRETVHATASAGTDGPVEICVEAVEGTDLILITMRRRAAGPHAPAPDVETDALVQELEQELQAVRQALDEKVASSQAAEEELRATSEEVRSMNEELRTTVEELEASKEELQSVNQELNAVNERLTDESRTSRALADDLSNLLASAALPVLMLDKRFRIRRRTPALDRFFGPGDTGQSLEELTWRYNDDDLLGDARHVLKELVPVTREIQCEEGTRHRRRILPYRTSDDRIDGVVIVFEDIEALMRIEDGLRAAQAYAAALVRAMPAPLVVLDADGQVEDFNPAFRATFSPFAGQIKGRSLSDLLGPRWRFEDLAELLEVEGKNWQEQDIRYDQDGEIMVYRVSARRIPSTGKGPSVLVSMQDITGLKRMEHDMAAFTAKLHHRLDKQTAAVVEKTSLLERIAYAIGHDLKEPVRALDTILDFLAKGHADQLSNEALDMVRQAQVETRRLGDFVLGLLTFTKAMLDDVHRLYPLSVRTALESEECTTRYASLIQQRNVHFEVHGEDKTVLANLPAFGHIMGNVIRNAIVHNRSKTPEVHVHIAESTSGLIDISVRDNGPGLPRAVLTGFPRRNVATRGFGLTVAHQMAQFLEGEITLESPGGGGAVVHALLPNASLAVSRPTDGHEDGDGP